MEVLVRVVAGVLLVAHGLVHLLFIAPDARSPGYAFSLDRSWLLPEAARRPVAYVLMAAVVAGFCASALALWGLPGLSATWPGILIVAAALSLALLVAFWDRRLLIGVAISAALIVLAVVRPTWIQTVRALVTSR